VLALEVMEVAAELKLANSDDKDEAADPVAVERTDWMLDWRLPTEERALFCWEVIEEMTEEAWDWAELMTDEPLARALEMPDETAEAALLAELTLDESWAETTAAKAATATVEKRMVMVCGLVWVVELSEFGWLMKWWWKWVVVVCLKKEREERVEGTL
jgi:hypothetical protein